ncbi:hypothetical protein E2C01_058623 [Portunus trituberculatus]|uniref:Uncharacterized protein n=1 Tax=Portunus trituberculatus TaxID=210409 RepID=A0A5B7H3P3_PORTR|nr:hypothetical protein [Portunus trituberculatus]
MRSMTYIYEATWSEPLYIPDSGRYEAGCPAAPHLGTWREGVLMGRLVLCHIFLPCDTYLFCDEVSRGHSVKRSKSCYLHSSEDSKRDLSLEIDDGQQLLHCQYSVSLPCIHDEH